MCIRDSDNTLRTTYFNISTKLDFLQSYLDTFPSNCGLVGDEYWESFHQDISAMERRYHGKWISIHVWLLFLEHDKICPSSTLGPVSYTHLVKPCSHGDTKPWHLVSWHYFALVSLSEQSSAIVCHDGMTLVMLVLHIKTFWYATLWHYCRHWHWPETVEMWHYAGSIILHIVIC